MPRFCLPFLLVLGLVSGLPQLVLTPGLPGGMVLADDHDGGGDDGGGGGGGNDDDDGGGSSGGNDDDDGGGSRGSSARNDDDDDRGAARPRRVIRLPGLRRAAPAAPAPAPRRAAPVQAPRPPAPEFAPSEIVTLALDETDLAALLAQGFTVTEEAQITTLGLTSRRLAIPAGLTLTEARAAVRTLPSGQDADFNHYYRSEQAFDGSCKGADCPARQMIAWPAPSSRLGTCGSSVTLGMIDTDINEDHETFAGARLEVTRLNRDRADPSKAVHGTAVAALLVGDPSTRSPGLVPGARLVAVDTFHRQGGDERSDSFSLIQGLDLLAQGGAQVVNLSLAGPPNTALAAMVDRMVMEQNIVVVAAVGNDGPRAEPAHPAALAPVIAVTAVDRRGTVFRRAQRGEAVDLAAPGVNVWTAASISGARWKTGTSFAVPFVTAAAAMLRESRPELTAAEIAQALVERARDLGDPGRDPVYGAGLLNIDGLCDSPL